MSTTELATFEDDASLVVAEQQSASSQALVAQAVAAIQARAIMALKRPRSLDQVRQDLLKRCESSAFAAVAIYHKPIGKGVEGPSIRFVETALRCMTNTESETIIVSDDSKSRTVRVAVSDLETNTTFRKDVVVEKVVERRQLREGQPSLGSRRNSYGDVVYLVPASEDDLLNKEGALASKALRTCGLRLIPGELVEEAMRKIRETQHSDVARDPDASRKAIADAFGMMGVRAEELGKYLGHDLGSASPAEQIELRAVYAAIKEGEASWPDALAFKLGPKAEADAPKDTRASALQAKIDEKLKAARGGKRTSPAAPQGEGREPGDD